VAPPANNDSPRTYREGVFVGIAFGMLLAMAIILVETLIFNQ
jgi:hypothetical protein